jgi:hypothetical protein
MINEQAQPILQSQHSPPNELSWIVGQCIINHNKYIFVISIYKYIDLEFLSIWTLNIVYECMMHRPMV